MKIKNIIITLSIILIISIAYLFYNANNLNLYEKNLFYMDTYINVKIYSNNELKANNALTEVENIYKTYHELTDRYNEYDNIINIYYINHNLGTYEIDSKLYDVINYGIDWYEKSNHLLNINMGNVIDIWKQYRDNMNGIPSLEELQKSGSTDINNIIMLENNMITNNGCNIDLGAISKGYTTGKVGEYLDSIGIKYYLINAGGNVLAGESYKKDNYKIGIKNPLETEDIFSVVNGHNISVVTSGSYERYYEYDGKLYHHIINPNTLYPSEYIKSVSIITSDSALGDALSTTLFMMDVDSGIEFIKNFDAEAIWYTNENEIIKSEGYSNYE